ncbi:UNVERIFIED_CONTAM: hypothetical protein Sradi_6199700 [Sesamum radiatum]|uniref:Chromo domain-containing protein n=1 Tax=Sesamum radiatum TaxID=300843 RepID=A0AAW2K8Z4_SESRA
MFEVLKTNLHEAQNRMKVNADKRRTEREFKVGDYVYLGLQPYRQRSVHLRKNLKLAPKYFGPFLIEAKIGAVAYRLKLPPNANIHPIFHVSLLNKHIGHKHTPSPILPVYNDFGLCRFYPFAILARRLLLRRDDVIPQVLVKWKGFSPADATWEDYYSMVAQFLDFFPDPRGQGSSEPGSNVTILAGKKRRPRSCLIISCLSRQIEGSINKTVRQRFESIGENSLKRSDVVSAAGPNLSGGLDSFDRVVAV